MENRKEHVAVSPQLPSAAEVEPPLVFLAERSEGAISLSTFVKASRGLGTLARSRAFVTWRILLGDQGLMPGRDSG